MASKFTLPFISSLVIAACAAFGASASAAPFCPTSQSFFGTIQRVNGSMLTVQTPSGHWADVRIESGARISTNGNSMRPGVFVGAYGCVTPNGVFNANEVTLTTNQADYQRTLTGVVQRTESGRLIVRQTDGHYADWFVPNVTLFTAGQNVTGIGMIATNGAFYPQSINGHTLAFEPTLTSAPTTVSRTITLTGTVQRVGSNAIVVWEPNVHRSGMWIVSNSGRFHVGERVSATGTEDRSGKFYVQQITIL